MSSMGWHKHEEIEHVIMVEGSQCVMEYIKDGANYKISVSKEKSIYFPPGTFHRMLPTETDCLFLAVLIPGSETFPKSKN